MTINHRQPRFRRPIHLPPIVKARRLRLAGLAETNRLKYELTMLAVAS